MSAVTCEEKILKRPDGTYVLIAFKSVGVTNGYERKAMPEYGDRAFPKKTPPAKAEPSVWEIYK